MSVCLSVCLSQTMVAVWVKQRNVNSIYVCLALSLLFVKAHTCISCNKKTAGTSRVWVTVHCPCEVIRPAKASD